MDTSKKSAVAPTEASDIQATTAECSAVDGVIAVVDMQPQFQDNDENRGAYDSELNNADAEFVEIVVDPAEIMIKPTSTTEVNTAAAAAINQTELINISDTSMHADISDDIADDLDTTDPVRYCGLRVDEGIIHLLMNNPCHPGDNFSFPKSSKDNRQCPRSCFYRVLPDMSKIKRNWLSYSTAADRLFCLDCMLFGGPASSNIVWTSCGYNTWSNAARDVQLHESSEMHKTSESSRLLFVMKRRIDHVSSRLRNAVVDSNRRAAYVAVKALRWLSMEMVAIRGHNSYDGKFLSLYTLLAEFDPAARAYLDKLSSIRERGVCIKPELNILSPRNLRRMLTVMRDIVVSKIVTAMKSQGVCSIIADGTQDESKLEACCLILRYVEEINGVPKPVERTIGIFTTGDTGGQSLSSEMIKCMETANVDIKSIIGQSYDGASNMSGRYKGVRSKIEELQPMGLYVWCKGHRLNLVVENILACCRQVRNALGTVQELYVFFGGHKRHSVLLEMQTAGSATRKRTLKRVADTTRSWRSAEDGVNTILECFDFVVESLEKLSAESCDSKTVSSAEGLLRKMSTFEFIATVHVLQLIFQTTGPASRILQSVACDMAISTQIIANSIVVLQQHRSDSHKLDNLMTEATKFAEAHGVKAELPITRTRRVPKQSDDNAVDYTITDPNERFRVDVFNVCLDTVIAQLTDRFAADKMPVIVQMQYFAPFKLITEEYVSPESITELCEFYRLDPVLIARELAEFRVAYKSVHSLVDVADLKLPRERGAAEATDEMTTVQNSDNIDYSLNHLVDNDTANDDKDDHDDDEEENVSVSDFMHWTDYSYIKPLRVIYQLSAYPTLTTLYKILSSLAVTSCSAERTLSRVRIIKNRLRSTMQDDWFSALTLLACERDISESLRVEDVVDKFAGLTSALRRHLL